MSMESKKPARFSQGLVLASMAFVASALSGCEKEEDRKIYEAQACLDAARNAGDADVCVAKIQGNESSEAYLIRCSANFVAQEFTGPRIANAFQKLKDNESTATDPMATMFAFLVFSKTAPGHSADDAVTNCKKSGLLSMRRMAEAAKTATLIAGGIGGTIGTNFDPTNPNFDQTAIDQAITDLKNLTGPAAEAKKEELGNLAISMNESFCGSASSSFKDNEVCTNLQAAVGAGADAKTIGAALLEQLSKKD